MKKVLLLVSHLFLVIPPANSQQISSKAQFLKWFDANNNLFYENESLEYDFKRLNLEEIRKDTMVKNRVLSLLDFENKIKYEIEKNKRLYFSKGDSVFRKNDFYKFLSDRGLLNKKDSIVLDSRLYKLYQDSTYNFELNKIEEEVRKSFKKIDLEHKGRPGDYNGLSRSVILLQGFMRYPESYDSLKKWLHHTPKFVDKQDVIVALSQMGDKEGIHAYSKLVDSLLIVVNKNPKFVTTDYFNHMFSTDLFYINKKEVWLNFLKIFDIRSRYDAYGNGQSLDARYYILDHMILFLYEKLNDKEMEAYWDKLRQKEFESEKLFTDEELLPIKKWITDNIDYFLQ